MSLFDENFEIQAVENVINDTLMGTPIKYRGRDAFILDVDKDGIKTVATLYFGDYKLYTIKGLKDLCKSKRHPELQNLIKEQGWRIPSVFFYQSLFGIDAKQSLENGKYKCFLKNFYKHNVQIFNTNSSTVWTSTNGGAGESATTYKKHQAYSRKNNGLRPTSYTYYYDLFNHDLMGVLTDFQYHKYWGNFEDLQEYLQEYEKETILKQNEPQSFGIMKNSNVKSYILLIQDYNKQYDESI